MEFCDATQELTHACDLEQYHDGDHVCICGEAWR